MLLVLGRWPVEDYTVFARREFDPGQKGCSFLSTGIFDRSSEGGVKVGMFGLSFGQAGRWREAMSDGSLEVPPMAYQ